MASSPKMKGLLTMRKEQRVVIVGAGSTHTPGIIQSLLAKREQFPLSKLVLFDIDAQRVEKVAAIMNQIIAKTYPNITLIVTTDEQIAYQDIDFVFIQVRPGGLEMRRVDEQIPLKYGVVGQETCGPGGSISYGIRSIPAILHIIEMAKKGSPNCWILNYSNPAAIVAQATRRVFNNEKIINICDMPVAILLSFAKMLGLEKWDDLDADYFGLNHFGWFTALYDKEGTDRMAEVKAKILAFGMIASSDKHHKDPDWQKTWKQYNQIVADFGEFLPNSYLQYYLYAADMVAQTDPNWTRADMVINGREKELFAQYDLYLSDPQTYLSPLQDFTVFGDFIVDIAASIAYNLGHRYLVIVENNGAIPNLPPDAMVEVPAYLRFWGPEPISQKPITAFYKGLIENQLASETLAVDAYFEKSYAKALQAIAINKTVPSTTVAKQILADLINENGDFWPVLTK
ncbi:MAG: 6-phospho-alpha-glucosidase [Culicoidibacterales bacterium]